jgi:hypothetical protein
MTVPVSLLLPKLSPLMVKVNPVVGNFESVVVKADVDANSGAWY